MRVLWIGILLLFVATAIVVVGGQDEQAAPMETRLLAPAPDPAPEPEPEVELAQAPAPEFDPTPELDPAPDPDPEPEAELAQAPAPELDPTPELNPASDPDPEPEAELAQAPDPDPTPIVIVENTDTPEEDLGAPVTPLADVGTTIDEAQALIDDLIESVEQREAEAIAEPEPVTVVADAAPSEPSPELEVTITEQDDGTLLLDDRYTLKGSGTREDPYRVSWELLISASKTYDPRSERFEIPGRVQMLHDKWARVTGYLAFPLAGRRVEEGLIMLNQWDGCCIGVPPSPYDGIEFRLTDPIEMSRRHVVPYGTATGIFKVDPYLVNGFLVGLFLMEEVEVDMGF